MKIRVQLNKGKMAILVLLLSTVACSELVKEGIEVSYPDSEAVIQVEPLAFEMAAAGETVSYAISVSAPADIKSCIIQASVEGKNGSGFNVSSTDFDDPFADHIFGTIREGIRSFKVRYDYIIPDEINKSRITFTIIDQTGKASLEKTVEVVPSISLYDDLNLYARDRTFNDALATIDGKIYPDIKTNYSQLSEASVAVQEKIDIIFYYDKEAQRTTIAAPASNQVNLELNIENNTLFKFLDRTGSIELKDLTSATLHALTSEASILSEGTSHLHHIKVGDAIGFVTDLNAIHSLKAGILLVKGLHPANADQYEGVAYVMECEMAVQQ